MNGSTTTFSKRALKTADREFLAAEMAQTLLGLSKAEGLFASDESEMFGGVFGRDSAITAVELLDAYARRPDPRFLDIAKHAIESLFSLQGRERNVENGEEPGKFIHEFRARGYERLLRGERPWYVSPDGTLRNYDSLDATPLALIAAHRYWEATGDNAFLERALPHVRDGLAWMSEYGDADGDFLLEFSHNLERHSGGLVIQSWTDSRESFLQKDRALPEYPIAPVEVQAFAWLAFEAWSDVFRMRDPAFADCIRRRAEKIRDAFNEQFLYSDRRGRIYAAQCLDGKKRQIRTVTGNPLLALWAARVKHGTAESVIRPEWIPAIVRRGFETDLFHPRAGIRTMGTGEPFYNSRPDSYHNGSFWPMLNCLIHAGLLNFGFVREAKRLRTASLAPIAHFKSAIELYQYDGAAGYGEYACGIQRGCRRQAWSAGAVLALL